MNAVAIFVYTDFENVCSLLNDGILAATATKAYTLYTQLERQCRVERVVNCQSKHIKNSPRITQTNT